MTFTFNMGLMEELTVIESDYGIEIILNDYETRTTCVVQIPIGQELAQLAEQLMLYHLSHQQIEEPF